MLDKPKWYGGPQEISAAVVSARSGDRVNHIFLVPSRPGRRPVSVSTQPGEFGWVGADGLEEVLRIPLDQLQEAVAQRATSGVLVFDEKDCEDPRELADRVPLAVFA